MGLRMDIALVETRGSHQRLKLNRPLFSQKIQFRNDSLKCVPGLQPIQDLFNELSEILILRGHRENLKL